jgi:hypothetical protein
MRGWELLVRRPHGRSQQVAKVPAIGLPVQLGTNARVSWHNAAWNAPRVGRAARKVPARAIRERRIDIHVARTKMRRRCVGPPPADTCRQHIRQRVWGYLRLELTRARAANRLDLDPVRVLNAEAGSGFGMHVDDRIGDTFFVHACSRNREW